MGSTTPIITIGMAKEISSLEIEQGTYQAYWLIAASLPKVIIKGESVKFSKEEMFRLRLYKGVGTPTAFAKTHRFLVTKKGETFWDFQKMCLYKKAVDLYEVYKKVYC